MTLAQALPTPIGTFHGIGPLGLEKDVSNYLNVFVSTLSIVLGVLTVSAGLLFIFQIFGGALSWLSSGGEKQALQNAQKRISNAVVGLFVVVASYSFIYIIGKILGLDILDISTQILNVVKVQP